MMIEENENCDHSTKINFHLKTSMNNYESNIHDSIDKQHNMRNVNNKSTNIIGRRSDFNQSRNKQYQSIKTMGLNNNRTSTILNTIQPNVNTKYMNIIKNEQFN